LEAFKNVKFFRDLKTKKTLAVSLNTFLSLYAIYKAKWVNFWPIFWSKYFSQRILDDFCEISKSAKFLKNF